MIRRALVCAVALFAVLAATQFARASTPVPTVRPGGRLPIAADGFRPHAAVVVQVVAKPRSRQTVRADRRGHVRTQVAAPHRVGRYEVLVVGRARSEPSGPNVSALARGHGDRQSVRVEVPRAVERPFRVRRGGGSGVLGAGDNNGKGRHGGAGSGSDGGHAASDSGGAGLSSTGAMVERMLEYAAVAIVAGALIAVLGRRRRRTVRR